MARPGNIVGNLVPVKWVFSMHSGSINDRTPLANRLLRFKNICLLSAFCTGDLLMDVVIEDGIYCTHQAGVSQLPQAWVVVSAFAFGPLRVHAPSSFSP